MRRGESSCLNALASPIRQHKPSDITDKPLQKYKVPSIFINLALLRRFVTPLWTPHFLASNTVNAVTTHQVRQMTGSGDAPSRRLRVLLDMDQVLCNFEGHFLDKYRERFPDAPFVPLDERNTFYLRDQYEKLQPGLAAKCASVYNAEGFFRELPPIDGAIKAAIEIAAMKDVDVFICTSPMMNYAYCLQEKFAWAHHYLGDDWIRRMIIAKDKTMVTGDVLIDDRVHIKGAVSVPTWEHIVFLSCYNKKKDFRGKRCLRNWTDGEWRKLIEDLKGKLA